MNSGRQYSSAYLLLLVLVVLGPCPLFADNQLEANQKDDGRDLCMSDVRSLAVCMLCYHRTNQKMLNCCQSMNIHSQCLDNISELVKHPAYDDLVSQKFWADLANSVALLPLDIQTQRLDNEHQTNDMIAQKNSLMEKRALEEIRPDLEPLFKDEDDDNIEGWEDYELNKLEEMIKRRSPFLGKRRSPFLGKRRSPFLGKRRSPFLGKRRSPFLGKRRSPFLGKRDDANLGDMLDLNEASLSNEKRGRSPFLG